VSGGNVVPSITAAEHIGPDSTGDNIQAKRVADYAWDGANWQRKPLPFFSKPYDEVLITYTDSTKAVMATAVSKLSGVTQQTITFTSGSTTDDYVRS
jgi:hypothetical protein